MGLVDLLVVALISVLEVLLITGIGLSLALDRINLLGSTARHNLNNLGAVYKWAYVYFVMRIYADKSNAACTAIDDTNETQTFVESSMESVLLPSKDANGFSKTTYAGRVSYLQRAFQRIKNFTEKINLKMVFAPSTIAAIIEFIIGAVSPIRKLMIGDSAPLRVFDSSASLLGEATIPSMTLIVGANLHKGLKISGVSAWVIVGVIGMRYILMPLLGIGMVKAAHHFGMVGSIKEE
ncbi:hypothetical protein GH714_028004 [Hevea brasiliensis]|uniref:Uncharacterized protein n=1 Tax=Hevea brasiliensis TaxID=3981 RepID=A0A6A6KU13_HEVBR|nr:hypothetical protein GH714_028004 [Hevea brasiliensis]